ncbi:MAG: nicotinate-nucleotide--dimethylbenzimidazole phosphoribosyltransferase [Chloroflexi bacterium]|nr:nicotinate-nucleotide--dimethylbenzimidazole phosphoribosyltransferase [Chloroflexota bacterium]
MDLLDRTRSRIGPLDVAALAVARERQDHLTKPPGSLGRLEELAIHLVGITGRVPPSVQRKAVIVMAGDHGVAEEGVSAYPQEVTGQMVQNFLRGGAAINVLARQAGARVVVVDMGVAADLDSHPDLRSCKVARGTSNLARGPAMSQEEARRAVETGIAIVQEEVARGLDIVVTGDMGIANTTASSAIVAALTGSPPELVTGRGTGIDERRWAHKVATVRRALAVNQPDPTDALEVLATVGGFEIGGLAGVILGAAAARVPVVVDGFISGAAALLAVGLCPGAREYLIAAHTSVEPGHRAALGHLGLRPLLDLGLRLGEGSGGALALPLLEAACRILAEMATFAEAAISGAVEPPHAPAGDADEG